MNAVASISSRWTPHRVRVLLARIRHRQLQTALAGDVIRSARYADRARRVRLLACQAR